VAKGREGSPILQSHKTSFSYHERNKHVAYILEVRNYS